MKKKVTQRVFQCEMIRTDEDFDEDFVKMKRTFELVKLELKEGKKVKRVCFYERNSTNWELVDLLYEGDTKCHIFQF